MRRQSACQVADGLARRDDAFDGGNADLGVDIDMAADMGHAEAQHLGDLAGRLAARVDARLPLGAAVREDAVVAGWAEPVAEPVHADERLVEMGICGAGLGSGFALAMVTALDHLPLPEQAGTLAALMQGGGFLIASRAPLLLALVHDRTGSYSAGWMIHVGFVAVTAGLYLGFSPGSYGRATGLGGAGAGQAPPGAPSGSCPAPGSR
ncbi:hypothetical protein [Albidovulum sp.]|uniref:hypothetical protein n=1 Tax=Albidovulum sp. TaxID=1872424 RepID=UPI0039B993B0